MQWEKPLLFERVHLYIGKHFRSIYTFIHLYINAFRAFVHMSTEFYRNISLQDLLFNDGKSDNARYGVLLAKQHFLNYHQCNLETGRQEEAKYFRYVIL